MSDKPEITLAQIKARAGGKSYSRGESYYHQGAVFNPIRRENIIEARCQGSYPQPYHTTVEFFNSDIVHTTCNCQYDWGGDCKHIIALLLTYYHEPELFDEKPAISQALADYSKNDLIEIIEKMIVRYPDLQSFIDRPTSMQIVEGRVELDTLRIRQDLREAFGNMQSEYYDYHDYGYYGQSPVPKIVEYRELAQKFAIKEDWLSASQVYRAILEEFVEIKGDYYHDEDGAIGEQINITISELGACLEQNDIINDTSERRAIFHALLDVDIWDTEIGGFDIGYGSREIILNHIRPDDIPPIRQIIEDARNRKRKNQYSTWGVEIYTSFLMELDVIDEIDPEITLKNLRDEGMYELLARKLLELGRIDEAIQVVKKEITGPYEMFKVANLFVDKDQPQLAQQLVTEFLKKQTDNRLTLWLIDYYQQHKNVEQILHWQQVLMRQQPNDRLYADIKVNAQALGQWETVQQEIITDLKKQKLFSMLTRVYLMDEEWELAWQTFPKAKHEHSWMFRQTIDLEVADAIRHVMPERAIEVYRQYIQSRIDSRGRDNYQQAAT